MKLLIIIPAYNEQSTIGNVLRQIPNSIPKIDKIEVLVIDDGSKDKTKETALKAGAHVVSHRENRGVGAAFNTGLKEALKFNSDIVVNIDADGQFDPQFIPDLIKPIIEGKADFTSCSRFIDKSFEPNMPMIKKIGNKVLAWLISFLLNKRIYDIACGFRAYSKDAYLSLNLIGDFTYTQESLLDLSFKGFQLEEVALPVRGIREVGNSKVANNLFNYAFRTFFLILKTFKDYKPLKFFGYISSFIFLIGSGLVGYVLIHKINFGTYTPYKAVGIIGLLAYFISLLFLVLGVTVDMLDRIRLNQEELLYYEKKRETEKNDDSYLYWNESSIDKDGSGYEEIGAAEDRL